MYFQKGLVFSRSQRITFEKITRKKQGKRSYRRNGNRGVIGMQRVFGLSSVGSLSGLSGLRRAGDLRVVREYASYNVDGTFEVMMPALSPTMTDGKILSWEVKVGDVVQTGDVLASIETDKANMDFESPEDGVIAKIIVEAGGVSECNTLIALMVPNESDVDKLVVTDSGSKKTEEKSVPAEKVEEKKETPKKKAAPKQAVPDVEHIVLEFPALSPNMTEGKIVSWLKQPGDSISVGDTIAEIETDKAVMGYEATDEGFLASILVEEGVVTQLNVPIGIVVENEADIDAVKDYKPTGEVDEAEPEPEAEEENPTSSVEKSSEKQESTPERKSGERVFASPLARKLASDKGYDISQIRGTGPEGRILAADVEEYTPSATRSETKHKKPVTQSTSDAFPEFSDTDVSNVRKVIASRLTQSKQTIPHYYLTMECKFDALMSLRKELNDMSDGKYKLSVNDFLMKAAASSMRAVPIVNAEWRDTVIRQYNDVNINVAVSTDRGLITPVVRNINKKSLSEISSGVKAVAERARENTLKITDLEGGTFTISNLGMFGITQFSAVINPPQAAILAVGAPTKKLLLNEAGNPTENTFVNFTLSCDHRVIDGAVGAQWLQEFKKTIENPLSLMV